jgi:hypothetical protein
VYCRESLREREREAVISNKRERERLGERELY